MLDMNPMRTVARRALLPSALTQSVPAAFAETPDVTRTSRHYQFISTARVIDALARGGIRTHPCAADPQSQRQLTVTMRGT